VKVRKHNLKISRVSMLILHAKQMHYNLSLRNRSTNTPSINIPTTISFTQMFLYSIPICVNSLVAIDRSCVILRLCFSCFELHSVECCEKLITFGKLERIVEGASIPGPDLPILTECVHVFPQSPNTCWESVLK